MSKNSGKPKVTAAEFHKYFMDKTGVSDPRDVKDALDVLIFSGKIYADTLQTVSVISIIFSKEGALGVAVSPQALKDSDGKGWILKALNQVKTAFETTEDKTTEK